MTRDKNKDRRSDMRLVKPDEKVEPRELDEATDALRAAVAPAELSAFDNEALLAMTLGDDVSEISDAELQAAEALRLALSGVGADDTMQPLAELAVALRAAHGGAEVRTRERRVEVRVQEGPELLPRELS